MTSRQPERRNPPPVQRIRLRYSKTGVFRFASHRDFSRVFERALRRAGVPMAYSSGFNPRPRVSYTNAAATGAASRAEYLEIGLAQQVSVANLVAGLNEVLPEGFCVEDAVEASGTKLAERLQASLWLALLPTEKIPEKLAEAVSDFLNAPQVLVERKTKKGMRSFDVRNAVLALDIKESVMHLKLRHVVPLVRPDDVISGLNTVNEQVVDGSEVLFERLAQGPIKSDGAIGDPLREDVS